MKKEYNFEFLQDEGAQKIIKALGENTTRFIGGCVRDVLYGKIPQDLDLASTCVPTKVIKILTNAGIKVIPTGINHGTVTAIIDGTEYEITTLRSDHNQDGRYAKVEYIKEWKKDAERRDFTVNAISVSLDGRLYDYFGGEKDVLEGKIKFIGNAKERIEEDALRILRFFRFSSSYSNGKIDYDGLQACIDNKHLISKLSTERVRDEILKILMTKNASRVMSIMQRERFTKMEFKIPVLERLMEVEKIPNYYQRFMTARYNDKYALAKEMKMPKKERKYFDKLQQNIDEPLGKSLLRKLGKKAFTNLAYVKYAHGMIEKSELEEMKVLAKEWKIPQFPITGKMLMHAGLKEGKELGHTLKELEKIWEENDYKILATELLKL